MTLNILTFSTLFPNAEQHRHGIFVETRLRHLRRDCDVRAEVLAPVPWFPLTAQRYGVYATYARVAATEQREGVTVHHPRYLVVPKLSWRIAPLLLYLGARRRATELHARQAFDLIDAHYFYPDGVAAVMLGRALDLPVIITARGSDINVMPDYLLPRRMIQWATRHCAAMVTVSNALRDALIRLGAEGNKVTALRNGVDLDKFSPREGLDVRARFGIGQQRVLLSVGNLVELKGNHLTIGALKELPDCALVLVGDGPERAALEALAMAEGVGQRVHFVGTVPQSELPDWYSAADALVLASRSEGWANVLLEGMACGCPAVAADVWGMSEVVAAPAAGVLMAERTAPALAAAVRSLLADYPGREHTRAYAEQFDWGATSRGQYELMTRIAQQGGA